MELKKNPASVMTAAIDWYANGETDTHIWDSEKKYWVPKVPVFSSN